MSGVSNGGDVPSTPKRRWGPSLGVCQRCDKLRKVQFVARWEKWLCTRCDDQAFDEAEYEREQIERTFAP